MTEFNHRCEENINQERIDELDKLIADAQHVLYHWKD